jgi:hypothetical protein
MRRLFYDVNRKVETEGTVTSSCFETHAFLYFTSTMTRSDNQRQIELGAPLNLSRRMDSGHAQAGHMIRSRASHKAEGSHGICCADHTA